MKAIRLENVSKYYQSQDQVSVGMKHITLSFELGEFVAITGESGSGKSTLLNVISGLDKYEDGEMYVMEEETSHFTISDFETYRSQNIGFVFQNYNIIDSYTVYQNIILALELQGYPASKRKERALKLIESVGLTKQTHQKASKLSGGQKQRAVIARALAKDTPILVCDEPTGNLDQASAKSIMKLLHEVSKDKLVVVVTHEFDQVAPYATRRIKMSDGEVVEDSMLLPHDPIAFDMTHKKHHQQLNQVFSIAFRSLFAQPKRFVFMLLLLTLVISVFTIVYSNQMFGIRTTGLEQSQVYPSVPNTRVLVERRDGKSLSESDINIISAFQGVEKIYPFGALFFNQTKLMIQASQSEYMWEDTFYINYVDSAARLKPDDLIVGRLPELANEVVIHLDFYYTEPVIKSITYTLSFLDYYGFDFNRDIDAIMDLKIVGYTDVGASSTLYFSETYLNQAYPSEEVIDIQLKQNTYQQLLNNMRLNYLDESIFIANFPSEFSGYDLQLHESFVGSSDIQTLTITFNSLSLNNEVLSYTKSIEVSIGDTFYGTAYISKALQDEIMNAWMLEVESDYFRLPSTIASVSISNQLAGQRLTELLDVETYKVFYPSNLSSMFQSFFAFLLTVFSMIILTILGLFLYAIIHAVTRNMMQSRNKDFAIYRSVGAHEQTLSFLVILEQMILSGLGLIIAVIILQSIILFIPNHGLTIEYMSVLDYVLLTSFIMLFSMWLGLRFNKKIFKLTVIQSLTNGGDAS